MSTTDDGARVDRSGPAAPAIELSTAVGRGLTHELRAMRTVLWRDLIRTLNYDIGRVLSIALMPLMFLLILGTGIGAVTAGADRVGFTTFIFPGVVAMAVILAAVNFAASFVWDQESGFARVMLVAPVRSLSIVLGKVLSCTIIAILLGVLVVAFAWVARVPYDPLLLLSLVGTMALASFTMASFSVLLAVYTKRMESFQGVSQLAVMPLMFLSGALFPLQDLPRWLTVLTHLNPITYAVDPMRQAVFWHLDDAAETSSAFTAGVTWFGWTVPVVLELALLAAAGVGFVFMAVRKLNMSR